MLRQVPQAFPHRPQAGDRRPVRLPRPTAGGAAQCGRRQVPRGAAAGDGDARPSAVLAPLLCRVGHPHGALASHRPAHFRQRHRNGCGPTLLPGAGGAWPRAGAGQPGRRLHPAAQPGGCRFRRQPRRRALLPVEPDAALGAARRACARTAREPLPDSDAALPAWAHADQEGAGGDYGPHWYQAPGERPRGGRRFRRTARLPG